MNLNLIWASRVLANPKFDTPDDVQEFATAAKLYLPELTLEEIQEMELSELGEQIRVRAETIAEQVAAITAVQNLLEANPPQPPDVTAGEPKETASDTGTPEK